MKVTTIISLQITAIEDMCETPEKNIAQIVRELSQNIAAEAKEKLSADDVRVSQIQCFTHEGDDYDDSVCNA